MSKKSPASAPEPVTIRDLTERQEAFVREYVDRGGRPGAAADAAVAAGYARPGRAGRAAARVRASELLRNPNVLSVLRDELTRKLNAGAALGVSVLEELALNAKSEQVRLSAAVRLIEHSSLGPPMSRSTNVHLGNDGLAEMIKKLDEIERAERQTIEGNAIAIAAP